MQTSAEDKFTWIMPSAADFLQIYNKYNPPVFLNYVKPSHFAGLRPSIPPISPPLPHGLPHRFAAESRHENGDVFSFLLENSYAHIKAFLLSAQKVCNKRYKLCNKNYLI